MVQETAATSAFPGAPGTELPLPQRFAQVKANIIAGNEAAIVASWNRLLQALRHEIEVIAAAGTDVIPSINFVDIQHGNALAVQNFTDHLRRRGVAVIRNVVPPQTALRWKQETLEYLASNPHTRGFPQTNPQLFELYWSPAQIKARAHPNVLAAQRFAMASAWHCAHDIAYVSPHIPVTYADRLRIRTPGDATFSLRAHIDGGSVERWEPDGYGRSGTYEKIFAGRWEEYDPWESSTRLTVTSDLYNGAGTCSMFRMFQGTISMSSSGPGEGTLQVVPMLQLTTAYVLLRPFFAPRNPNPALPGYLDEWNWQLEPVHTSLIQGAVPGYAQEVNAALHPHLQLGRSMISAPRVEPGDYVIWHCDAVHGVDPVHRGKDDSAVMYVPACPLTQTNALFLARQRKAFLLGQPAPDFGQGGRGESAHLGRPGVSEVNDAGSEDALRAMGLLPWEDSAASSQAEQELIRLANAILFPDRYEM